MIYVNIHKKYRGQNHKKGQIEAFGLAIIVIMLILGLLLFVALRRGTPKNEPLKIYVPQELASNLIESIASTTVYECTDKKTSVESLMDYCSRGINVTKRCGYEACPLLNKTMNWILNRTIGVQNYPYRLYTDGLGWPNGGEIELVNRNCTIKKERVHGETYITQSTTYQLLYLNLDICKQ